MGRHDGRRAQPAAPWHRRLRRTLTRWSARAALGVLAGAVVAGATLWAGTSWESARWIGLGAAVVVLAATALAATLPPVPGPDRRGGDDPATRRRTGPPGAD